MATVSLTTTPIQIDDGSSYTVLVANTGATTVDLSRGGRLRPGQTTTVYPEGTTLTAATTGGAGTVTTTVTAKPLPNAADPATLAASSAFTGTYARRNRASRVLAAFQSAAGGLGLGALPTTADTPTILNGTARTITSGYTQVTGNELQNDTRMTPIGMASPVWNTGSGYLNSSTNGSDAQHIAYGFTLTGTEVEMRWRGGGTSEALWIFVNGKPTTAAPFAPAGLTVTAGGVFYTKLTFGSSAVRRVEVYHTLGQPMDFRVTNGTSALSPLPSKGPSIYALGDSYTDGSALIPALQTWARQLAFAAGCELYQAGQGGTGWVTNGGGGNKAALTASGRLNPVIAADPDAILIFLGGNDPGNATAAQVQAAVTAVLSTLAAGLPNTPVIIAGTYCSIPSATLDTTRAQINQAIRAAALASTNCVGFVDPIGTAVTGTVPAALVNGQAYSPGDTYTYAGAIYQVLTAHTAGTAPTENATQCLTWLTGTGNATSPTGDGNRDMLLSSDGTHWTLLGASVQAQRIMHGSERILRAWLNGSTFTSA